MNFGKIKEVLLWMAIFLLLGDHFGTHLPSFLKRKTLPGVSNYEYLKCLGHNFFLKEELNKYLDRQNNYLKLQKDNLESQYSSKKLLSTIQKEYADLKNELENVVVYFQQEVEKTKRMAAHAQAAKITEALKKKGKSLQLAEELQQQEEDHAKTKNNW